MSWRAVTSESVIKILLCVPFIAFKTEILLIKRCIMYCVASQERIRAVKENLQSCKNLLHCKRDELRRLWIEGVEMKTVHAALDAVEKVTGVTDQLPKLISSRNYLTCTELIVDAIATLETELTDVDALQEVC